MIDNIAKYVAYFILAILTCILIGLTIYIFTGYPKKQISVTSLNLPTKTIQSPKWDFVCANNILFKDNRQIIGLDNKIVTCK